MVLCKLYGKQCPTSAKFLLSSSGTLDENFSSVTLAVLAKRDFGDASPKFSRRHFNSRIKMNSETTVIIVLGIFGALLLLYFCISLGYVFKLRSSYKKCDISQSPYCYNISCPCDSSRSKCEGYAFRETDEGYYCINDSEKLHKK